MKTILLILTTIFICAQTAYTDPVEPTDTNGDGYRNISTLDHLRWVSENKASWSWKFRMDNDIDASDTKNWNDGEGWSPIGNGQANHFSGEFDGQGHSISNLTCNRPDKDTIGCFGCTGTQAMIKNMGLVNCTMNGDSCVGGLVGCNQAQIRNCYCYGKVTGEGSHVGAIAGQNDGGGIKNCHSNGKIQGGNYVGGIAGQNKGEIESSHCEGAVLHTGKAAGKNSAVGGLVGSNSEDGNINNCYCHNNVTGSGNGVSVGGLVGDHDSGNINNCYCTSKSNSKGNGGSVGGLIGKSNSGNTKSCFWDTEISEQTTSDGGTGKTTAEMKTESTFTDADWDFETIWAIDPSTNDGYPYLREGIVSVTENILPTTNLTCSPNPCTTASKIGYSLNNAGFVNIAVYDMLGNEVATLVNDYQAAGSYEIIFNSEELAAGVYFISINTAGTMETGKIIVVR